MGIGDDKGSSSESTESDEVAKKTQEEEKAPSSSRLLSRDPKNPFSTTTMLVTPAKKKMFTIESLGTASKVIVQSLGLKILWKRKGREKMKFFLQKILYLKQFTQDLQW